MTLRIAGLVIAALCAATSAHAQMKHPTSSSATHPGRTRVYFVAADEVDWTYVPARGDAALTGKKDDWTGDPAAAGTIDPNASTYRKALFREYTDSSFATLKPRAA